MADFDPLKHPRNTRGEFSEILGGLAKGSAVHLPGGIAVEKVKVAGQDMHRVVTPGHVSHHDSPEKAADHALELSARSTHPDSLGGARSHKDLPSALKTNRAKARRAAATGKPKDVPNPTRLPTASRSLSDAQERAADRRDKRGDGEPTSKVPLRDKVAAAKNREGTGAEGPKKGDKFIYKGRTVTVVNEPTPGDKKIAVDDPNHPSGQHVRMFVWRKQLTPVDSSKPVVPEADRAAAKATKDLGNAEHIFRDMPQTGSAWDRGQHMEHRLEQAHPDLSPAQLRKMAKEHTAKGNRLTKAQLSGKSADQIRDLPKEHAGLHHGELASAILRQAARRTSVEEAKQRSDVAHAEVVASEGRKGRGAAIHAAVEHRYAQEGLLNGRSMTQAADEWQHQYGIPALASKPTTTSPADRAKALRNRGGTVDTATQSSRGEQRAVEFPGGFKHRVDIPDGTSVEHTDPVPVTVKVPLHAKIKDRSGRAGRFVDKGSPILSVGSQHHVRGVRYTDAKGKQHSYYEVGKTADFEKNVSRTPLQPDAAKKHLEGVPALPSSQPTTASAKSTATKSSRGEVAKVARSNSLGERHVTFAGEKVGHVKSLGNAFTAHGKNGERLTKQTFPTADAAVKHLVQRHKKTRIAADQRSLPSTVAKRRGQSARG
jgi:hypothetical protein